MNGMQAEKINPVNAGVTVKKAEPSMLIKALVYGIPSIGMGLMLGPALAV